MPIAAIAARALAARASAGAARAAAGSAARSAVSGGSLGKVTASVNNVAAQARTAVASNPTVQAATRNPLVKESLREAIAPAHHRDPNVDPRARAIGAGLRGLGADLGNMANDLAKSTVTSGNDAGVTRGVGYTPFQPATNFAPVRSYVQVPRDTRGSDGAGNGGAVDGGGGTTGSRGDANAGGAVTDPTPPSSVAPVAPYVSRGMQAPAAIIPGNVYPARHFDPNPAGPNKVMGRTDAPLPPGPRPSQPGAGRARGLNLDRARDLLQYSAQFGKIPEA
jgi:hypothetical protein